MDPGGASTVGAGATAAPGTAATAAAAVAQRTPVMLAPPPAPLLIGHGYAAWPATVDMQCFDLYLRGANAAQCATAHMLRLLELHSLPPNFFGLPLLSSAAGGTTAGAGAASSQHASPPASVGGSPNRTPAGAATNAQSPLPPPELADAGPAVSDFEQYQQQQQQQQQQVAANMQLHLAAATGSVVPPPLTTEDLRALQPLPAPVAEYVVALRADVGHLVAGLDEQIQFFRTLENDEKYFDEPSVFIALRALPVHPSVRLTLVERYYALDDQVVGACFGRRLTKSDADDLAGSAWADELPPSSVRRQVECLRRVHKTVTAAYLKRGRKTGTTLSAGAVAGAVTAASSGRHNAGATTAGGGVERSACYELSYPATDAIRDLFKVSEERASQYATWVFAAEHQLGRPPLTRLNLDEAAMICEASAEAWCAPNGLWLSPGFRASMAVVAKLLLELTVQRDVLHLLGSQGIGPMSFALRLVPVGGAMGGGAAAETTLSAAPSTGDVSSAPAGTASPQNAKSAAARPGASPASPAPPASPPPAPAAGVGAEGGGGGGGGPLPVPTKWAFSARLEADVISILRALAKLARSLSQKDELRDSFAHIGLIHDEFARGRSEDGHQVSLLVGRLLGALLQMRVAMPRENHADTLRFVAVTKLTLQLLYCSDERRNLPAAANGSA